MMFCVNVNAQEKATGNAYKDLKKQEKVLDKELQKKAIKEALQRSQEIGKEGFKTPVGNCLWPSNWKQLGKNKRNWILKVTRIGTSLLPER